MTGAPAPILALEDAAIGYGREVLLRDLTLGVSAGDFLAIVGPNGGGKTTLLRTLLGVQPPLGGARRQPRPLRVGYVPQRDHVDAYWPLTAAEVAVMGRYRLLAPGRRPGAADREAVRAALARVGIEELAGVPFRTLSGGQRQRTLIARALASEPELLALDEPTNGMDPAAELDAMDVLRALHRGGGLAVVMVSHRLEAVANYAQRLCFVDKDKRLFRVGALEAMLTPEALGALYGRRVAVREEGGRRFVYPEAEAR
ncbi:metal ABC transporter ATP-binding protein [Anaeromyxobacter diazotrophicus]|uniref:Manganese ABC transporter ATP-binding protein n=1 Tax=Anaeromyxobacter diazotrophicus TaxID=2590199 RepID=A0A7I9VS44_9BACT|nr:metal ABC transporter ATP-binding protein [Anaeromyxobacter diazotrophicus]GEJ59262.1 manganese ABC transporter ATP-binding protein [Anaeromyxobacter diazotrophicus]